MKNAFVVLVGLLLCGVGNAVSLEGLVVPAEVSLEFRQPPKRGVSEKLVAALREAIALLRRVDTPENAESLFQWKLSPKLLENRHIEFVLLDGDEAKVGRASLKVTSQFPTMINLTERTPKGPTEALRIYINLDPNVLSLGGEVLPHASLHLFRVLLRPFYGLIPRHLAQTVESSEEMSQQPNSISARVLFNYYETQYGKFICSLASDKTMERSSLAGYGYAYLALIDWTMLMKNRRMQVNSPFQFEWQLHMELLDSFVPPAFQQEAWKIFGEAFYLAAALPPENVESVFGNYAPTTFADTRHQAIHILDSRDKNTLSQLRLHPEAKFAVHTTDLMSESHTVKTMAGLITSSYFWVDKYLFDPKKRELHPYRLGEMTLALAAILYHEAPRKTEDTFQHSRLYRAAAIKFLVRLTDSPLWEKLSEDERRSFLYAATPYRDDSNDFLSSCLSRIVANSGVPKNEKKSGSK